jgi:hypothetical protein
MKPRVTIIAAGILACAGLTGCTSAPMSAATTQPQSRPNATGGASTARSLAPSGATPGSATAAVISTKKFVVTEIAEERLAPDAGAVVFNEVYRGQVVKVYETRNGWARVSKYFDGRVADTSGEVACWIACECLASERPPASKALNIPQDPRILYLERAPGYNLNERDVLILHAAAHYYLETGQATRIEDGGKSVNDPGLYYLNFGGPQNTRFRSSDIPNLERRIKELQKEAEYR